MAYLLGDLTLPTPKGFRRKFMETGASNVTIEGETTKKVENRKERFTLVYQNLTPAQANAILAEYELDMVRDFQVTESNLTIAATGVLIDVDVRNYPLTGKEYRQDFKLILTEVK